MFSNTKPSRNLAKMLLVAVLFYSCDNILPKYEERERQVIIDKKYTEIESRNNFGAFDTMHYFLYTNGELEDVELELYIGSEVGDTIVKTERFRVP